MWRKCDIELVDSNRCSMCFRVSHRHFQHYLLTHFFRDIGSIVLIFGATDLFNKHQVGQQIKTIVNISDQVIVHPLYNSTTFANNIALIRLTTTLEFNDYIQSVRLPFDRRFNTFTNSPVIISGWGSIDDNEDIVPYLQYGYSTILDLNKCMSSFEPGRVNQDNICLEGASSCNGDSGGPCLSTVTGELIGVSSYVPVTGCGSFPSVYSRVTYFRDWIKSHTGI